MFLCGFQSFSCDKHLSSMLLFKACLRIHMNFNVHFFLRPEYPEEELEEENIIEDDAELTLNKVDDTLFGVSVMIEDMLLLGYKNA